MLAHVSQIESLDIGSFRQLEMAYGMRVSKLMKSLKADASNYDSLPPVSNYFKALRQIYPEVFSWC